MFLALSTVTLTSLASFTKTSYFLEASACLQTSFSSGDREAHFFFLTKTESMAFAKEGHPYSSKISFFREKFCCCCCKILISVKKSENVIFFFAIGVRENCAVFGREHIKGESFYRGLLLQHFARSCSELPSTISCTF